MCDYCTDTIKWDLYTVMYLSFEMIPDKAAKNVGISLTPELGTHLFIHFLEERNQVFLNLAYRGITEISTTHNDISSTVPHRNRSPLAPAEHPVDLKIVKLGIRLFPFHNLINGRPQGE